MTSLIETWVTRPTGEYLAHLERSAASPFRDAKFSLERKGRPGQGSIDFHKDNALLADNPDLLNDSNLVWMRYNGRTFVWVIEERGVVLDESEHETDWYSIAGRGALQLLGHRLVFPPQFASGGNTNPASWGKGNQWRQIVNRPAGEMLWDLISETNARFEVQFARGSIGTTGSDGVTAQYRFDNLLDVVQNTCEGFGEVKLDGLTFSYDPSPGADLSGEVIFEEGGELLKVELQQSSRDQVTWVVAEGMGEGVTAKLALASNLGASPLRREAYTDGKDAANVPLLAIQAHAALVENGKQDSVGVEIAEDRYKVFQDFDLYDVVRVIAPSRKINTAASIVAIYVSEDGDRTRVEIDVNTPRQDLYEKMDSGREQDRRSIDVRNRQPQGQLVPFSFSGADVFDDTDTMDVYLAIPDRMYLTVETQVKIRFRQYFAQAKSASSGGASTSGPSSASTSDDEAAHIHNMLVYVDDVPPAMTKREYTAQPGRTVALETSATGPITTSGGTAHNHGMPHSHSTPDHTHGLTYGVFKEAYPGSHSVLLKTYELVSGSWVLRDTSVSLTDDFETLDLTAVITGPGDWRLELKSEAGQPNGGRLGCDVYGYVLGAIQSS